MKRTRILGVVLAAGGGTRWVTAGGSGHKLLAQLPDGRAVVAASVGAALAAEVDDVCVVTGSVDIDGVLPAGVHIAHIAHNEHWADGQATSLRVAIDWAERHGYDAIVVGLGDQPWVGSDAWSAVAERTRLSSLPIVVPTFGGKRGQPVGLRREVWAALPTEGDAGARILIAQVPELVDEFPCAGDQRLLTDIDTPGDLSSWN